MKLVFFLLQCMCAKLSQLGLTLCNPWTVAHQAPLSTEFSNQAYWGGQPFPSPEGLPDPGIEPGSPALAGGFFTMESPGKPFSHRAHPSDWNTGRICVERCSVFLCSKYTCLCLWGIVNNDWPGLSDLKGLTAPTGDGAGLPEVPHSLARSKHRHSCRGRPSLPWGRSWSVAFWTLPFQWRLPPDAQWGPALAPCFPVSGRWTDTLPANSGLFY